MGEPVLHCGLCVLRPWRSEDLESLVRHADNANVSRGLRDRFPYPYTRSAGEWFLADVQQEHDDWRLAIEVEGEAVGGAGINPGQDVHRVSGEVGYWLGEAYWGRGIVPAALRALVPAAMDHFKLTRVAAGVYSNNPRSMRVLEKAGFECEGVQRAAVLKRGELLDLVVYAVVRPLREDPSPGTKP